MQCIAVCEEHLHHDSILRVSAASCPCSLLKTQHPPAHLLFLLHHSSVCPLVMNPYGDTHVNSDPCNDVNAPGSQQSPHSYSTPDPQDNSHNPYLSTTVSSAPVIQTGHSFPSPDLPLPASDPTLTLNPYSTPITLPTSQVSVTIPSPDLHPSPLQSQCLEETCPDLECAICFSQFNNVFRCPKMLQCKHTFCLECLARMNVKSAQPNAIQCPLCRGFTPLPTLGLPRLATDSDVLSYLPAAMQRVYSIRFLRDKGKLQVKRSGCVLFMIEVI